MPAHVANGADPDDPYAVQSGYLPEPGPQGLPHLPAYGEETANPPSDSFGPGKAGYAGDDPTLTTVSPNTRAVSTNGTHTLTGTNFSTGATVSVSGSGVTVSAVNVVSATSITATFTVAGGAAETARTVTVTNTDGGTVTKSSGLTVTAA